jgi:O-antigen ligase
VGYNGFLGNFELTAHNSFVLCFAELGLLGYFLWIGLILVSVWQLRTIRDSTGPEAADPELRSWASATLIALYVLLTTAFFLSQTYAPPLYVLLGIAAAIIGIDVRQRNKPLLPEKSRWGLWTLGTCFGSIVVIYLCVISRAF